VVGVFFDEDRARAERRSRQAEEDENGIYQHFRYSVQQHWVRDASWDAIASSAKERAHGA
jgi:hypothetical protein